MMENATRSVAGTTWLTVVGRIVSIVLVLLLFFVSLELMGDSFKLMGSGFVERVLSTTSNPFVGLFVGIVATAVIQSSSAVTSMVVALAAAGGLSVSEAIPIVMGSNLGTSITSTIVSLGHVTRREEFRRAFAAGTVHDVFNFLTVLILLPVELTTGLLTKVSAYLTDAIYGVGGADVLSPLKFIVEPITTMIIGAFESNGILVAIVAAVLLVSSLILLATLLRRLVLGRVEYILHKYVFGSIPLALALGTLVTVLVQSSSITTSLMIPLAAAGIVTVSRIFPFILGANIGTTATAIMAALAVAAGDEAHGKIAIQVALAHFSFNGIGTLIFLPFEPVRKIPIRIAEALGDLGAKNRLYAVACIAIVFFVIPLLVIFLTG